MMKAVAYVRMSTDRQDYSIRNQMDVIQAYAKDHGLELVGCFEDAGRSGLTLDGRASLVRLLATVVSGAAAFDAILVYDVSRWGRFQDVDESAHYEFLCRKAGIKVIYCTEPFENDGRPTSAIVKVLKRTMAGELSRELSAKVRLAHTKYAKMGRRQGGPAGYGLRRMVVDANGVQLGTLKPGEVRLARTGYMILVPGPKNEVEVVRLIYRLYVKRRWLYTKIAKYLDRRGIEPPYGENWKPWLVKQILHNEKYVGNIVYNRSSYILKSERKQIPPNEWIRIEGAYEAVVGAELFWRAQAVRKDNLARQTDEEILEDLRALASRTGGTTRKDIDADSSIVSSSTIYHRFGSISEAYRRLGHRAQFHVRNKRDPAHRLRILSDLMERVRSDLESIGNAVEALPNRLQLVCNTELTIGFQIARYSPAASGRARWELSFPMNTKADLTIIAFLNSTNQTISHYFLRLAMDPHCRRYVFAHQNPLPTQCYRFDDLGFLGAFLRRRRAEDLLK